jgi:predicted dehydrogenase
MTDSKKVRLAVIGVGNMGQSHARDIVSLPNTELVAVCDIDPERLAFVAGDLGVKAYVDYNDLLLRDDLDGILVATPHYDHVPISIAAFERGIHVLAEKPIAVHGKDARKMIAAYEIAKKQHPNLVFAAMFMQRTYGYWQKIKDMIDNGELGQLVRVTWLITNWFRTQAYYNEGGWRATWRGEGGGVLMNQCPHNLDLYQWMVGMPQRVRGFAALGKYHNIEVEDEVTAYFEHKNGMVGHFITTTAESPGTNRLEIVGEQGKLVYEYGKLSFFRNAYSMFDHIRQSPNGYDKVEFTQEEVVFDHHGQPGHALIIENFANAILNQTELIASGVEGYNSVVLGNAIMSSSFEGRVVELPLDEDAFEEKLLSLIKNSRYVKPEVTDSNQVRTDVNQSFNME